jgi:hypothetical protein
MVCCSSSTHFVVVCVCFWFGAVSRAMTGQSQREAEQRPAALFRLLRSATQEPPHDPPVVRHRSHRRLHSALLSGNIIFEFFFLLFLLFKLLSFPYNPTPPTNDSNRDGQHTIFILLSGIGNVFFGTPNSRLVFSSGLQPGCPGMPVTCSDKIKAAKFARRPSVGYRLRGTTTIYINRGAGTN